MENKLIKITEQDMGNYLECLNKNLEHFVPMLPFVEHSFHTFDMYKSYPKRGLYLMDRLSEDETCLYHMYQLHEGDSMLRATLVLPSSWEKRVEIMTNSIENLKNWLDQNAVQNQFMIQCLEYGEIEYYPTLNHYLVPILLKTGFEPTYRMYMSYNLDNLESSTLEEQWLNENHLSISTISQTDEVALFEFYQAQMQKHQNQFVTHCTRAEFKAFLEDEQSLLTKTSFTLKDQNGKILGAIIGSQENGKLWLDNLIVSVEGDSQIAAKLLITASIEAFKKEKTTSRILHVYMDRHLKFSVDAYKACGFKPFEFWVDLIYNIQHR